MMREKGISEQFKGHRAVTTNVTARLVGMLFGLLFQILVVKILAPSQYATYALTLAAVTIGRQLLSFGVGETLIRFVPWYMALGDVRGLKVLAKRMLILRAASLLIVAILVIFSLRFFTVLPTSFMLGNLYVFAIWLVATILYFDAFDLAQSLMAQRETAIVTISEVAMRFAALCALLSLRQSVDAQSVINISALTSTLSLIWLSCRVWPYIKLPWGPPQENSVGALSFALGRYASATTWLISSPSVVRLVAASGLDALPLAAFSFAQGLYGSMQRAFPAFILLQSMEPILLTKLAQGIQYEKILSSIAVVFKLELFLALSVFIASALAGPTIITLLARPEYAPYWYVLLFLGITQATNAAYRILEVVSSAVARQAIFFWVWPLGVLSTIGIYFTVHIWGIWAALAFPLLEGVLRVGLVMFFFRRDGMQIALDTKRSTIMILSAAAIVGAASYFVGRGEASAIGNLLLATVGVLVFMLVACAAKPLRPLEHQLILTIVPRDWKALRMFADAITRP